MLAAHYHLDNLVVILDHNSLQITGANREVNSPYPIDEKFKAFGWQVMEIDGHNISELRAAFKRIPDRKEMPTLLIANTVKGKGISFMENQVKWHHGIPSDEQYKQAMDQLKTEMEKLRAQKAEKV